MSFTAHDRQQLREVFNRTGETTALGRRGVSASCHIIQSTTVTGAIRELLDLMCSGTMGVTDHGKLGGLGDDDHTQYLNEDRHNALSHDFLDCITSQSKPSGNQFTDPRVTLCITDDGTDTTLTTNTGDLAFAVAGGDTTFSSTLTANQFLATDDDETQSFNLVELVEDLSFTAITGGTTHHAIDVDINYDINSVFANDVVRALNVDADITLTSGAALATINLIRADVQYDSGVLLQGSPIIDIDANHDNTGSAGGWSNGGINVLMTGDGSTVSESVGIVGQSRMTHPSPAANTNHAIGVLGVGDGAVGTFGGAIAGVEGRCLQPLGRSLGVIGNPDVIGISVTGPERCSFKGLRGTILQDNGDLIVTAEGLNIVSTPQDYAAGNLPSHWTAGAETGNGYFKGILECDGAFWADSDATVQGDAQINGAKICTPQTTTATGTQNDFAPTVGSVLRCNPASALTITGFSLGQVGGYFLYLANVSSSTVQLNDQDGGSTAANRIITGTGGNIVLQPNDTSILIYDNITASWRIWA